MEIQRNVPSGNLRANGPANTLCSYCVVASTTYATSPPMDSIISRHSIVGATGSWTQSRPSLILTIVHRTLVLTPRSNPMPCSCSSVHTLFLTTSRATVRLERNGTRGKGKPVKLTYRRFLVFRRRRDVVRCRSNRRRPTRRRQREPRVLHRRSRTNGGGGGHRGMPRRTRRYARTRQAPRGVRHVEHHHRARGYGSLTFSLDSLKVIRSIKSFAVTRTRKKTASTIRPSPQPSVSVVRVTRRHPRHPYVRTSTRSNPGAASYAKTNHDARRNRSCYAYSDVPETRDGLMTPPRRPLLLR